MTNKDTQIMIGVAVAVGIALVVAWPKIRIELLRRNEGVIEENGYLYDPQTQKYYDASNGAVVWQP